MSDKKLKKIIEQAIQGNELAFDHFLQDVFKKLKPQLLSLTNSEAEVQDVFIVSMQKFWERFIVNQEQLPKNSTAYIYTMCKNAWLISKRNLWNSFTLKDDLNQLKDKEEVTHEDTQDNIKDLEQEWLQKRALSEALESLSPKCKTLMESEIDPEIKLKDLQQQLGFQNYQALVQAKYNCKKRLIKKVYEIFDQLITYK